MACRWGLGGWLLTPMIGRIGMEKFMAMRERVAKEITTTFASHYTQEVSFEEMLQPEGNPKLWKTSNRN